MAALTVLVGHCVGRADPWWINIFWDAADAVVIFFLLSGYVLALQLMSPNRPNFAGFLIRRFFRIWPVFAIVVIATFVVLIQVDGSELARYLPPEMQIPRSSITLLQTLLMFGDHHAIVPPVWSLYVEMRLSLIFPLLMILVLACNAYVAVFIGLVVSVALSLLASAGLGSVASDIGTSARFICLFVVGAVLALPQNPLKKAYEITPLLLKCLFVVISILLLGYRMWPTPLPAQNYVPWIGTTVIFVALIYSPLAEKLLAQKPLTFLGSISYGLYLVHLPVLVFLTLIAGEAQLSIWVKLPIVLAISVVISWLLKIAVEQPMIQLGKKLSPQKVAVA